MQKYPIYFVALVYTIVTVCLNKYSFWYGLSKNNLGLQLCNYITFKVVKILFNSISLKRVGQFAWLNTLSRSTVSHQRLNVEQPLDIDFKQWLVGFVDGSSAKPDAGSFTITRQGKKSGLYFKISQSSYNLRVLHYIKKQLKRGNIVVDKKGNAEFRIRDIQTIRNFIIPIFEQYPLITSEYFNYLNFIQALEILEDNSISIQQQNILLDEIKMKTIPLNFVSPYVQNMTKSWIIGFTEVNGSFYFKDSTHITHAFELVHKLDKIVLLQIGSMLGISKVSYKKAGYYTLVTTNNRAIQNIISYYKNTMKGMKSLEYRIWARSYVKHKGDYKALSKIKDNIKVMRTQRYNKTTL